MDPIMLEEIKQLLSIYGGGIKSVQRGNAVLDLSVNTDGGQEKGSETINISPVDPEKSVLLIHAENQERNTDTVGVVKTITLNEDSIAFLLTSETYYAQWKLNPLVWQVIEFK